MRNAIPFSRRKLDWVIVFFFLFNLFFITYNVDIEQLIIPDPYQFQQPAWPRAPMVRLIHSYGETHLIRCSWPDPNGGKTPSCWM